MSDKSCDTCIHEMPMLNGATSSIEKVRKEPVKMADINKAITWTY